MATVLIASDGSDDANDAARRAVALLGVGHRYVLVHVATLTLPGPGGRLANPDLYGQIEGRIDDQAREAVDATRAAIDVDAEVRFERGDPGATIARVAGEAGADVVVVGSRGLGAVKGAILGSVSRYVMQHAPCPVLVMRPVSDPAGAG